jgi:hypothetical protein
MATRFVLTPYAAEFPAANFPQLLHVNRRPALAFDAAVDEACFWSLIAPQGLTASVTAVITYMMASAIAGKVDFEISIEAVSDNDAVDLDAVASFDAANTITAPTVPGTAGYIDQITISLANLDSLAAGDYFRLSLSRDANDATNDTAAGDCYVLSVELRDSA